VKNLKVGDKVTAIVSSRGYAEYATPDAHLAIPIRSGISFAEASTIPVQGLSAYALLKFAAKPQAHETVLVQAAAGGVGLYLVAVSTQLHAASAAGSPSCWYRGNVVGSSRTCEIPIGQRWSEDSPSYPGQVQVHPQHAADRSAWFAPNRPGPNNLMYKGASQQQTSAGR
jgi:hypothetical protein